MQQRQHQADDIEEFAGKNIRDTAALARRHGYTDPVFAKLCGNLCVLGFKRHQAQQVA
ncbi:hypothetical protein [Pseudomonas tohonis]|uniref:Uncharacterized protein n=1 Tax=Pseudomonas tohonis TaxID=2725477 RepID=A0ABQ4VY44_9PSED|nr:hypothetical protein [Pseudomonas tohonis]GJN50808.1 hypothetical protein TUM20286_05600 [Pseudomonas tohonis]